MNKNLTVLHLFNHYLPHTEVWAYNIIKHLPETNIHIGAKGYLRNNFYDRNFTFVHNPLSSIYQPDNFEYKTTVEKYTAKLLKSITILGASDIKKRVLRHIETHKIDLVHTHFADVGCFYMDIFQENNIPFVTSFYGWDYERLPFVQPKYNQLYKALFTKATGIICEGKNGKNLLTKKGCENHKVHVCRLGIATESSKKIKRTKNKNQLKLVQIASFTEKKGYPYTVAAFIEALKTAPNMTLCLVGKYEEDNIRKKIRDQVATLGLEDKIIIKEGINYDELASFLGDYDVFIHPSCHTAKKDCEGGAPIVLLDAQATGMPVISTRHCDIPEEVLENKTGILVPEKNEQALAEAILKFYKMSDETYQIYSTNAVTHVEENFDIAKNAKHLKAVYQKLLS